MIFLWDIIFTLQTSKLRSRQAKWFPQDETDSKKQSWDLNTKQLASNDKVLTTMFTVQPAQNRLLIWSHPWSPLTMQSFFILSSHCTLYIHYWYLSYCMVGSFHHRCLPMYTSFSKSHPTATPDEDNWGKSFLYLIFPYKPWIQHSGW